MRKKLLVLLLLAVCAAEWANGAGEQMHTAHCCLWEQELQLTCLKRLGNRSYNKWWNRNTPNQATPLCSGSASA